MTARSPVEFTNRQAQRVGNEVAVAEGQILFDLILVDK